VVIVLGAFATISLLLNFWQWLVAMRFPFQLHAANPGFIPPVTILKPLKGADEFTRRCLESWLAQDYPAPVQFLFGVASADDPAAALVNQLIAEHPGALARLVLCGEKLGVNAKVSTLVQLNRLARHDFLVVSDADVLVARDYLRTLLDPLRDEKVGLVNSFYRLANPTTPAMRWEAIAVNADFWSQVLQGRSLAPQDFALGAVMAVRRSSLAKIGGFEALVDFLADDFQLGNRIVRVAGQSIALSPVVVDCLDAPMTWRQAWAHQLRWARTIRVSKPLPYAFSILNNAILWPLLWAAITQSKIALATLAVCLVLRMVAAQSLQRRLGAVPGQGRYFWLVPLKDLLQFVLWAAAFFGNHITWRGERFKLKRDGRLVQV